jgi:hypothetical protein
MIRVLNPSKLRQNLLGEKNDVLYVLSTGRKNDALSVLSTGRKSDTMPGLSTGRKCDTMQDRRFLTFFQSILLGLNDSFLPFLNLIYTQIKDKK